MLAPWMIFPQSLHSLSQVTMATEGRNEASLAWKGNKCRRLHNLYLMLNLSLMSVCDKQLLCPVSVDQLLLWLLDTHTHTHTMQVTGRRMMRTGKNRENRETILTDASLCCCTLSPWWCNVSQNLCRNNRVLKFPLIVPSAHVELSCQPGCFAISYWYHIPDWIFEYFCSHSEEWNLWDLCSHEINLKLANLVLIFLCWYISAY